MIHVIVMSLGRPEDSFTLGHFALEVLFWTVYVVIWYRVIPTPQQAVDADEPSVYRDI